MLAKFSGNTNFTLTKFSGQATSFRQATFSGGVNFNLAMFSGQAGFETTTFSGQANLSKANFKRITYFSGATFQKEADFNQAAFFHRVYFSDRSPDLGTFNGVTRFNYVLFEANEKIIFDVHDLSKVSFANTDITRVRFSEIAESRENLINLEGAMTVYRDLRENYEFRLRYDEAGKFFTREMELKRNYREVLSQDGSSTIVKSNDLLRRNLSLTGLYYRFSNYGESIAKPAIIGAITIMLSALLWHIQNDPTSELSLSIIPVSKTANFINVTQIWNNTHLMKAFERSIADFDPILSLGSDIKVGIIDYVVKIVGGGLTFGLLLIALRRKFERKYTR
jgi:hypothetical protein